MSNEAVSEASLETPAVEDHVELQAKVQETLEQEASNNAVEPVSEEAPAEAKAQAEAEAAPQEVDLSSQFAELRKRDRELRAERRRLDEVRQTMVSIEDLQKDPISVLKAHGVSADTIATALMGGQLEEAPSEVETPAALPKHIQEELDLLKQERQDRILADFRKEVFSAVEKDSEAYELLLNSENGRDLYWNAVVDYYQSYGEAPDYAELAKDVESALVEQGKKLLALKKFAPEPAPEAPKAESKPEPAATEEPAKPSDFTTLSKSLTADSYSQANNVAKFKNAKKKEYATSSMTSFLDAQKQDIMNKYFKD